MEGPELPAPPRFGDAGQRRRVSLLFADLCDYTQLNELLDPEDIDLLRGKLEEAAADIIHRHGGTVTQYYGDGILAVFGLPSSSENDVRAAVHAAIELRALPPSLHDVVALPVGFGLAMHCGVHCGLVFARRGDSLHGRYQLTGDAVNTTARLCAAAARGQVLVSETAMRGIEPFFQTDVVQQLTLKGKRLSVPAFRVHAASDIRTRFEASARRGLTAYVGRAEVLAQLDAAVRDAAEVGSRVVGLSGGPGIGKTRVIDEFARRQRASQLSIYRVTCESDTSVVPLQPWLQIIRQVLELPAHAPALSEDALRVQCLSLGAGLEQHAPLLANVLAFETGAQRAEVPRLQQRLVEAIGMLLRARPVRLVVLSIDDWQWVDELSRQVLHGVLAHMPRGLLALLATREWQSCDVLLESARRIELQPLNTGESARVLHALLPEPPQRLRQSLLQLAGGNPLFLEELCRSLPATPANDVFTLARGAVPHTVHGVIQARLERLPEPETQLLRVAAIIGNEFSPGLLADVSGRPDVASLLASLEAADLVREGGGGRSYRFKHGITRDVVYESVRLADRKRWHAAVASQIEKCAAESGTPAPHEALAHHYRASAQHARAALHAELAGDRAAAASALDRARLQYGTALAALDELPHTDMVSRRWLAISVKWARAWVYNPSPEQRDVLERARGLAETLGDLNALADVEQMSAWMCYALGEQQSAIQHCQRGLALAIEIGAHKLVGQLTSNLGQSHAAAGDYTQALKLLGRGMQLKLEHASHRDGAVPVGFAYALATRATIHAEQGDFAYAAQLMDQALRAVRGAGHAIEASMLALAAMNLLWQGQYRACLAACERAAAVAERILGPYVYKMSEAISGFSRYMLERSPHARAQLELSARWLESRHMGLYLSVVYGCAAEASLLAGEPEQALTWAERAQLRAVQRDPFGQAAALRVRAELRVLELGRSDERVDAWLDEADRAAQMRESRREAALNTWCRARILSASGARAESQPLLEQVRRELASLGMSHEVALGSS